MASAPSTPDPVRDALEEVDPVLASIRRTRLRPPLPEAELERSRRLVAEVKSDPSTWRTTEEIMATIESMRPPVAAE